MKLLLHDSTREQPRLRGNLLAISMHNSARRLGPHLENRHTLEMLLLSATNLQSQSRARP